MRAVSLYRLALVVLALVVAALLGAYVPLRIAGMVSEGRLDPLLGGVLCFSGIAAGAVVAFFAVSLGLALPAIPEEPREGGERLRAYRARQRAMLEELDEVKKLLEEIRDLLREGVGG
uniref:Uncharacterized protein n=1 Tax=Thermofilum pendens TaxID=2269 RepID=A0A7J3X5P8_THEPE